MRFAAPALAAALLLAGCNNSCQRLCVRMKTFAEDCGYTVSDAELDACVTQQDVASPEDKETCGEAGQIDVIERNWDCDSIADYWGNTGT